MTVNRTTLLDLPLPVTGTESGTWGDTTNNGLTQYVDIAIAGMSNLTSANFTAGALTIETTEGDSSATNISATSAQYAGFRVTSLAANSTITVGNTGTSPARSYRLINADATYSLTFKATGQTGVTLLPGQSALVAFNGTDYVIVGTVGAGSTTDNTVPRFDGTTGKILQSSGITIDDSNNVSGVAQLNITTLDATNIEVTNIKAKDGTAAASIADSTGVISVTANPILSGGTANGVLYLNGSKVATSGSALTFDGSVFQTSLGAGLVTNTKQLVLNNFSGEGVGITFSRPTDSTEVNAIGTASSSWELGLFGREGIVFATGGGSTYSATSEQMRLTSTGLGIGTSSISSKLVVKVQTNANAEFRTTDAIFGTVVGGVGIDALNDARSSIVPFGIRGSTLSFGTSAGLSATLDSSGNLGLGVTPSAANLGKALQITNASFVGYSNNAYVGANWYYGSGDKYIANGFASLYAQDSSVHKWYTAPSGTAGNAITFTQAMTLDASGNLGVGETSPSAKLHVVNTAYVKGSASSDGDKGITISSGGSAVASSSHAIRTGGGLGDILFIETQTANTSGQIVFNTNNTERARITSGGYFKASDSGSYNSSTGSYHEFTQTANTAGFILRSTHATYADIVSLVYAARNTTNNSFYAFGYYNTGAGVYKFQVADSGNVTNTNGSYGTISDAKMKTDIVDAGSQWADIKAIRFRKFKMKDDPSGLLQLGVVAQELEQTSPGLVDEHVDRDAEGNDLGTTTKSVKTSILLMKAAKALQEAMARIETLEAKVSALEGN